MPKINLDQHISFPIHSLMVIPTHKTMMYYATLCWSKYFRSENNYDKQLVGTVFQFFKGVWNGLAHIIHFKIVLFFSSAMSVY